MTNSVNIRFKSYLPGAGFNSAGAAKQGKTRVVGRINVTSYAPGNEPLTPARIGLSNIDHIDLKVVENTPDTGGNNERRVVYSPSAGQFYLILTSQNGTPNEYTVAATETVSFVAEGDSSEDNELLPVVPAH